MQSNGSDSSVQQQEEQQTKNDKKLCNLHALAEKKKRREIRDGDFQLYPLNCSHDFSEAQDKATLFLAKSFGRSDLLSFISTVPENKRLALFQSLLFEACGRTVNLVNRVVRGVTCALDSLDNSVQAVRLNLSGSSLVGSILPSLGSLQNLLHLDLSSNHLSGPIPPTLSNLVAKFDNLRSPKIFMASTLHSSTKETENLKKSFGPPRELHVQVTRSMPPQQIEIFKSLEGWAKNNILMHLKPVEKCWQPQDSLPLPEPDGVENQVKELRERARKIPDDYFVVLVGDMITEETPKICVISAMMHPVRLPAMWREQSQEHSVQSRDFQQMASSKMVG
ncbi:hypothetical protein TB1_046047 [Malus domestica]